MMEYLFDTTRAVVNLVFGGALRALSAHPLHPAARRRAGAVFLLAAVGVADDRHAAPPAHRRTRCSRCSSASGTTTRCRPARRPGAAWRHVAAPEQIVFGSDWPFANARVTAAAHEDLPGARRDLARAARRHRPRQRAAAVAAARLSPRDGIHRADTRPDLRHRARPHRAGHAARGASLFFPVIPAVKAALGLSDGLAYLTFSIALFGMAFATLFYGSLSDRHGRRRMLLSGLALFLVGSAIVGGGADRGHAGARAAGAGDRRRLRAGADSRHRARCLPRRPAWSRRSPTSPCSARSARWCRRSSAAC